MSIYVLRSGDLYKIGFSSNLGERVRSLMDAVPGAVEFIGHMPGGMDVESHLHKQFNAERFSGEWFASSSRINDFINSCLIAETPQAPTTRPPGAHREDVERVALSDSLRQACARAWPDLNHKQRIIKLASEIGWGERRVRSVYQCERYSLLASEAPSLDRWLADWICPEQSTHTDTERD